MILFDGRHVLVLEHVYYLSTRFEIASNRTMSQKLLEFQLALEYFVPMATYTTGLDQWRNLTSNFRDRIRLGF